MIYEHKEVLAFDMDGTLTESRQPISVKMLDMLHTLHDKGFYICILTGGNMPLIKKQILDYIKKPITLYIYGTNGSEYWKYHGGHLVKIFKHKIPWFDKLKILGIIDHVIKSKQLIPDTSWEDMVEDRNTQITFSAIGRNARTELKDKFDPDRKIRAEWVKEIKDVLPIKISNNYNVTIGGTTSIDFNSNRYTKGVSLMKLSHEIGASLIDFTFFGDKLENGGNDSSVIGICDTQQVNGPKELYKALEPWRDGI